MNEVVVDLDEKFRILIISHLQGFTLRAASISPCVFTRYVFAGLVECLERSNLHGFPPAISGKTGLRITERNREVFYNELGKAMYHKALLHLCLNSTGPSLFEKDSIKIANNTKPTKSFNKSGVLSFVAILS